MTRDETEAGTPVLDLTVDEYDAFLDQETERRMQMSADEFVRRYRAGELDEADPDVGMLAVLIGVGQDDNQLAA
jgi:hypothetical protein